MFLSELGLLNDRDARAVGLRLIRSCQCSKSDDGGSGLLGRQGKYCRERLQPRSPSLKDEVGQNGLRSLLREALERLRQVGVHCIDTTPDRFSMAVINRYLAVKRRELF